MSRGHKAKERVPAPGLDLVITRARAVRREGEGRVRDGRWKRETFEKSAEKLKAKEGRKVRMKDRGG